MRKRLVAGLDELWQNSDLSEIMDEEVYESFTGALESRLQQSQNQ
jgi:hypothetical protein